MATTQLAKTRRRSSRTTLISAMPLNGFPEASVGNHSTSPINSKERRQMITTNAYFRAERRQFAPERELQDWLEAEAEVDKLLRDAANNVEV